ncbi:MAG TPA: dihydrofolate reductase, partial [Rariglobus sp.]
MTGRNVADVRDDRMDDTVPSIVDTEVHLVVSTDSVGVVSVDGGLPSEFRDAGQRVAIEALVARSTVILGARSVRLFGGRPPGRRIIVLTTKGVLPGGTWGGASVASSPQEALDMCAGEPRVYVLGGVSTFAAFMPIAVVVHRLVLRDPLLYGPDARVVTLPKRVDGFVCTTVEGSGSGKSGLYFNVETDWLADTPGVARIDPEDVPSIEGARSHAAEGVTGGAVSSDGADRRTDTGATFRIVPSDGIAMDQDEIVRFYAESLSASTTNAAGGPNDDDDKDLQFSFYDSDDDLKDWTDTSDRESDGTDDDASPPPSRAQTLFPRPTPTVYEKKRSIVPLASVMVEAESAPGRSIIHYLETADVVALARASPLLRRAMAIVSHDGSGGRNASTMGCRFKPAYYGDRLASITSEGAYLDSYVVAAIETLASATVAAIGPGRPRGVSPPPPPHRWGTIERAIVRAMVLGRTDTAQRCAEAARSLSNAMSSRAWEGAAPTALNPMSAWLMDAMGVSASHAVTLARSDVIAPALDLAYAAGRHGCPDMLPLATALAFDSLISGRHLTYNGTIVVHSTDATSVDDARALACVTTIYVVDATLEGLVHEDILNGAVHLGQSGHAGHPLSTIGKVGDSRRRTAGDILARMRVDAPINARSVFTLVIRSTTRRYYDPTLAVLARICERLCAMADDVPAAAKLLAHIIGSASCAEFDHVEGWTPRTWQAILSRMTAGTSAMDAFWQSLGVVGGPTVGSRVEEGENVPSIMAEERETATAEKEEEGDDDDQVKELGNNILSWLASRTCYHILGDVLSRLDPWDVGALARSSSSMMWIVWYVVRDAPPGDLDSVRCSGSIPALRG